MDIAGGRRAWLLGLALQTGIGGSQSGGAIRRVALEDFRPKGLPCGLVGNRVDGRSYQICMSVALKVASADDGLQVPGLGL